jgi:hypothetical protein
MAEKLTTFDPLMTILSHIRQNLASKKTFERKRHLSSHVQEIKKKTLGLIQGCQMAPKFQFGYILEGL